MRIAIFSDVHANRPALEPVLADIQTAAQAIEATDLPAEFAAQLREARGYR
jgi:hypothetical protein